MSQINHCFQEFFRQEEGPTAVEYAVMMALIIVVCIASVTVLGTSASGTFSKAATAAKASSS